MRSSSGELSTVIPVEGKKRANTMNGQHRNRYDEEFKKQAVLHHIENRGTLADSAEKFGITAGMLYKWIDHYSSEGAGKSSRPMDYELEIKRLQHEVKTLKEVMIKVILQKHIEDELAEKIMDDPEKILSVNGINVGK